MNDTTRRALKKTAITLVALIVVFISTYNFPVLGGYLVFASMITFVVGLIFLMFLVYEQDKNNMTEK
jgi:hypothetical protein